ncbi:zinc-dependent alcohol dehydrogenase [Ornithinimicrobium pekingense]|uniref:Oxidoreductase n=1 Tax=Ornithinimicrobium pekingense TaxID=384677 RepID=A0ABQ2F783_9MICO|nr:zinc-binding alcohol dehydrogenase [Ornithinimicrobium pekingense]GGK60686.1 oxidoreductase [Ornithinimicrobium pekingense]
MPSVVTFTAPRVVELQECPVEEVGPGDVRVRTWYSGISAGTELTAYRGSNPYLTRTWDAEERIFRDGPPSFAYPVAGWGYSEMGEVVEVGPGVVGLGVGDLVHGIWGHRSEAVRPARTLVGRTLGQDVDPRTGCFARVGAIALNGVLAADTRLGSRVAVFGQGVIGLLATRLGVLAGARVAAVDMAPRRLEVAQGYGAELTLDPRAEGGVGPLLRRWSDGGVDGAVELSGAVAALHEAIRAVRVDGVVAAAGFYQGGAEGLRLGEEFHHNRVRIVASQIGGVPVGLSTSWDQARLVQVFMELVLAGRVDVDPLITDVVDASEVGEAFRRLDEGDPEVLQVLLRFPGAPA